MLYLLFDIICNAATSNTKIIDNFQTYGRSSLGTKWQYYSDNIIGGKSRGYQKLVKFRGHYGLLIHGTIPAIGRGRFLQSSLYFHPHKKYIDASKFHGIKLFVFGNNHFYSIQLRNAQTWFPWQFFGTTFFAKAQWHEITLPFSKFLPLKMSTKTKLHTNSLLQIFIGGYKTTTPIKLIIASVKFY